MVRRLAVLLLLLALSLTGLAATRVRAAAYELDRDTLAVGEPLQLRITRAVSSSGPALDTLDLSVLQRDFEILERTLGRDSVKEILTLTLYARRSGRYTLPTLGLPGRAPRLSVTEGSERVPRVQWKLSLDPPEPLLRQPTTFTLEACDDGTLLWKRPQLPSTEGLLLRPLNETEIITTRDGQRCTAHRWHWALLPTASGALTLPLPVMVAGKFGTRLRFPAPALELRVQPLPVWLPAEAAVGRPEFSAETLPARATLAQPLAWRLRVTGAYSAASLQSLLVAQLRAAADPRLDLERYAPQIDALPGESATPQYRVTLYLVPRERAVLELPALQLPWYDPVSGLLMQQRLPPPHIEVIDPIRQRWIYGAFVAALVAITGTTLLWFTRKTEWRWRRREALKSLAHCSTAEELCATLLNWSVRRNAKASTTLRSWQAMIEQECKSENLARLVDALETTRYRAREEDQTDLGTLIQAACAWLKSIRPY